MEKIVILVWNVRGPSWCKIFIGPNCHITSVKQSWEREVSYIFQKQNALFKARPEGWDAGWLDQWGSSSRRRASAKPDVGNVWLFLYLIFLVIDDMYSLFTAPLRGGCALQNQDPGQWNDLEAFFDTFLFKSNLHLFVDVVEDVANSRKSRSTIGIKHGRSHNLKLCLDFIQWCFLF